MKNVSSEITVQNVTITRTADEWELYDKEGAEEIAKEINFHFGLLILEFPHVNAWSVNAIYKRMREFLKIHEDFGAYDGEAALV